MCWLTLKATLLRVPLFEVLTFDLSVEVVDDDDNDGWWDDVGWCEKSGIIVSTFKYFYCTEVRLSLRYISNKLSPMYLQ